MDIDFDALSSQLDTTNTETVSTTEQTSGDTTTLETAPAQETIPSGTTETEADDSIEVTFQDGTKEAIKKSELHNYVLRNKDYTKKLQALSETRKKYEALEQNIPVIKQQLQFAQQMQQNPQAVFQYAVEQLGPENAVALFKQMVQGSPEKFDPLDIPTYQDAEQMISGRLSEYEQKLLEVEQRTQAKIQQSIQEARNQQEFESRRNTYQSQFDEAINKVLADHKPLKGIKHMPDMLRFETAKKVENYIKLNGEEPSFEQAAEWLQAAAKEQMSTLEAEFATAKANSPLNNGIEPPGGNRPVSVNTEAKSYYNPKNGQTDWDSLLKDMSGQLSNIGRL